ncbi:sigma-70 family RNA polymerase sigma factor [Clavibacter michiganensis subsp. michiganensis]|uniref:sigma-70 family RNA polymerase sigma factor n=1 Tax=Clavibacter michiganensis TaxID=28447 RepID=UPI001D09D1BD|nr:sigma-70 family RNA polymerase sigma factor [Clavibacter michiganensis]UDM10332.1 sigma-70 family RNA polymerase sigma factor [Clavibacter michiganensis subsp. michiganensis]WDD25032.1 sigma-70 family RNA polymerase sigma factor [Clavibacter michiganensis subsp. michiganensis]WDD28141.1 sigma-70 family RNA polymerase sigma factor [Clavibacter michiganensis subsp. michiganensis]
MTGTLRTRALAAAPPASCGSASRASASTLSRSTTLPRPTNLPRPTPLAPDLTAARDEKRRLTHDRFVRAAAAAEDPAGDAERRRLHDQIVLDHLELADQLARQHSGRTHDWSDLRQVGYLGLVKAARRYDPGFGAPFVSFAIPTISGEIKRHLRDNGWVVRPPRHVQELRHALLAVVPALTQRLGRTPTDAELAAHTGHAREEVVEALAAHSSLRPASLDFTVHEDEGISLADTIGADDPGYARAERTVLLDAARGVLSDRDRRILHLRFVDECSQSEIAAELGVTQMQVSRLLARILGALRAELTRGEAEALPEVAPLAAVSPIRVREADRRTA